MMTFPRGLSALFVWLVCAITSVRGAGGFSPAWMQDAYWRDGKSEFNLYDARLLRDGELRTCEVIHILVREDFAPEAQVKADDWQQPGTYPVLKLNQILNVPVGLYVFQQMLSSFWTPSDSRLIKFSLTSADSCGNTFKVANRTDNLWHYQYDTYWQGMAHGDETFTAPPEGIFYDELPARVRSIDFSAPTGSFAIQLAPTVILSKKGSVAFAAATVSYQAGTEPGTVSVEVSHAGGTDRFVVGREPPHLLQEWHMADGGELKLKRSLKVAYWKYGKPGDRERALNDRSLQTYPK